MAEKSEKMDLKGLIASLNKSMGSTNAIRKGTESEYVKKVPLGNPAFDYVSTGGIPINRITELLGLFASTKTYHALLAAKAFQCYDWNSGTANAVKEVIYEDVKGEKRIKEIISTSRGLKNIRTKAVVFVDYEGTFNKEHAENMGIDLEALILITPPSAESGIDIVQAFAANPDIGLIIVDSMSAVSAKADNDASMEDYQMAANARFWNRAMSKIQDSINKNSEPVTVIMINTYYQKVGMVFGDGKVAKNGEGIAYKKSLSVTFSALKNIKEKVDGDEIVIGRNINIECTKNKGGQAYRKTSFFFPIADTDEYTAGVIDEIGCLLELGSKFNLVSRTGAWFSYGGIKAQGLAGLRNVLIDNTDLLNQLREEVYDRF